MPQTLFEQKWSVDSAVDVPEGMNTLEAVMKIEHQRNCSMNDSGIFAPHGQWSFDHTGGYIISYYSEKIYGVL